MVEWHHRLNGQKFEQTLVDTEGQGSLMCFSSWGDRVGQDLATEQQQQQHQQSIPQAVTMAFLGRVIYNL